MSTSAPPATAPATAAPAAPASPVAPAAPVPGGIGEAARTIDQVIQEAREKLAAKAATPDPPATPDPAAAPPPPPVEGETPPPQPSDGSVPPVEGEGDDGLLLVELPGRTQDGQAFQIKAPDRETAERLRQLRNGYMRGEEVRAAQLRVQGEREAIQEIETMLQADPEGFLFDKIPKERAAVVAVNLLLQDEVWKEVGPMLKELAEDDGKRELAKLGLENERLRRRDEVKEDIRQRGEMQRNAEQVRQAVALCIPDQLPPERQVELFRQLVDAVGDYADHHRMTRIDPRAVPVILAAQLREAGIDPVTAALTIGSRGARNGAGRGAEAPREPAPRAVARAATPPAPPTGAQRVAAAAAQASAASVPAPGAATPSAGTMSPPPKGQTVQERIDWYRKARGLT